MFEILKRYFKMKQDLEVNIFGFLFQKLWFSVLVGIAIFVWGIFFNIKHNVISSTMLSIMSIITSFLILSITIVLTKDNEKTTRNKDIRYKDVLLNNILFSISLSVLSIGGIFVYIFLANCEDIKMDRFLSCVCSFNFGLICFILNVLIGDLKFLTDIYRQ